jgi:hypothetical protein
VIRREVRIAPRHLRALPTPGSCNANSGVPPCTCQLAQVRRLCVWLLMNARRLPATARDWSVFGGVSLISNVMSRGILNSRSAAYPIAIGGLCSVV